MSDLISRSETYKELISRIDWLRKQNYELYCAVGDCIQDTLEKQSTAYDINKVVEELESNSFITVKQEEVQTKRKDIQSYIAVEKEVVLLKDAIEIVKQGSVSDDVCEWHCDEYGRWHTECHYLADNDPLEYTYCPYCGKKISRKE